MEAMPFTRKRHRKSTDRMMEHLELQISISNHLQLSPYPETNHGVNRLKRMDDLKEDKEDLNRSEMKSSASRGTPRREVPVSTIAWHLPASPIPS